MIRMSNGSPLFEEHIDKKYNAGESRHWPFPKICREETIKEFQPQYPYDWDDGLCEDHQFLDADNLKLYSQWDCDVIFPQRKLQQVCGGAIWLP